jgi:hypothetical protein
MQLKTCAVYPATLDNYDGSVGGLVCKGGLMAGKYVILQNTEFGATAVMSLAEIAIFGLEM